MRRCYFATLSSKGQITIPVRCLRELGWVKGKTRLTRSWQRGAAVIAPVKARETDAAKEATSL
jgi:bifunctional DNA-binding transcriptional regulator/antitoxin component of YhaV-PrlF toxin-antitoxin module